MASLLPIALQALPLIPGLIRDVAELVNIIRNPAQTPEEQKDRLDALAARLELTAAAVAAAPLPNLREE